MRHAFFADMGGFRVKVNDNRLPVPVNAAQLLKLLHNGHLTYPIGDKRAIDDKNKRDGLAR